MNGDWNVKVDQDLNRRLQNQMQDIKGTLPKPPLSMLSGSVDSLRTLAVRLGALTDQLSGVEPETDASNGIAGISCGGAFGEVERFAQEIDELVGTMARHLSRIERRL